MSFEKVSYLITAVFLYCKTLRANSRDEDRLTDPCRASQRELKCTPESNPIDILQHFVCSLLFTRVNTSLLPMPFIPLSFYRLEQSTYAAGGKVKPIPNLCQRILFIRKQNIIHVAFFIHTEFFSQIIS